MSNDNAWNSGYEHEKSGGLPLAFPYVPMQCFQNRYSDEDAIIRGTLFPELDLPFKKYVISSPLPKTPMNEIMSVGFVCLELRLYLDTHPEDVKALEYYRNYSKNYMKLKEKYNESSAKSGYNDWVNDKWPWEGQEC